MCVQRGWRHTRSVDFSNGHPEMELDESGQTFHGGGGAAPQYPSTLTRVYLAISQSCMCVSAGSSHTRKESLRSAENHVARAYGAAEVLDTGAHASARSNV
jgi:hypothetical protein